MNKKISIIVGMILLVGIVSAVTISISLSNYSYNPSISLSDKRIKTTLFFDCGKDKMNITLSEINGIGEDDISREVKKFCGEAVSVFYDEKSNTLKENAFGDLGFDEEELKELECIKLGNTFDSKTNTCEETKESEEIYLYDEPEVLINEEMIEEPNIPKEENITIKE